LSEAVYMPLGDGRFMPTELARGPWSKDHQHGGAPTGLLTRAVEQVETFQPMRLARITCEFLKPIPLSELLVTTRIMRPGRKVQWVAAQIESGGETVMSATALMIRTEASASAQVEIKPAPMPGPGPDLQSAIGELGEVGTMFAGGAVEILIAEHKQSWLDLGPGRAWFKLNVPLVAGEQPSSQQRAVSAADFGNGISASLDWGKWLFVNSDLTVNLLREPRGEWISLDSTTRISGDGTALTETSLADQHGGIGVAAQSLFVAPMSGASAFGG